MFLVIQKKHTLPIIHADRDGVTFQWFQNTSNQREAMISNIQPQEFLKVDICLAIPYTVPWKRVNFLVSEMIPDGKQHDYYLDQGDYVVQLVYSLMETLSIENIAVQLKNKRVTEIYTKQQEIHKMAVVLKRDVRIEGIVVGRAQSIRTTFMGDTSIPQRTYIWNGLGQKQNEPGINEGPYFNLSPRGDVVLLSQMDHDGFSNTNSMLPIIVSENCIVTIQFFNLKDKIPRFLEWSIRWGTLIEKTTPPPSPLVKRLSSLKLKRTSSSIPDVEHKAYTYKEDVTNSISAQVVYKFVDTQLKNKIQIDEIHLIALMFHQTLEAMNDAMIAKTI